MGKVKDNFDIASTKEDVHVFQKSPKKAVVVPVADQVNEALSMLCCLYYTHHI